MKKTIFLLAILGIISCTKKSSVRIWEDNIVIPTYEMGVPEPNPCFYVPSNYQGAQNRVYPYPFLDKISDKKIDKTYKGLFIENEYIKICVLPQLGGRLYYAIDKSNGYNFIYRNNVIKPTLIGMAGAWCSGGVEWNLPHHHRISCHMPVNYRLVSNNDGSKTIWVGEYEKRHGMKWETGLTVYPGKSYIESDIKLLNVTAVVNSFLCFANMAVSVNENYQVIFPPDVEKSVFHAKVQFADWPVVKQEYQGVDFTKGVDVSWWKNAPSPTSFFAYGTKMDFLAGIDHGKKSGTVLIGDHNICVGKKMWTWGNNEVQRLWDQMLTDSDGPYVELMMGAYSDNQPDYSWNDPYSAREAKMFYFPSRNMESIKNANENCVFNIEVKNSEALVQVNATSEEKITLQIKVKDNNLISQNISVDPQHPFNSFFKLPQGTKEEDLKVSLLNEQGKVLLSYSKPTRKNEPNPPVYKEPDIPQDITSTDELFLRGLRIEQFNSSKFEALSYYLEALKRDPNNININTQLGIYYIKRYCFQQAIIPLRRATNMVTMNHTKAKNSEPLFYLAVALMQTGKDQAAYDTLGKAAWNDAFSSASYYLMAQIDCKNADYDKALFHLDYAIKANNNNVDAITLKAIILRQTGLTDQAKQYAQLALVTDPLNTIAINELVLLGDKNQQASLMSIMAEEPTNYLESAQRYAHAGFYKDAITLLEQATKSSSVKLNAYPFIYYHLGYYYSLNNDNKSAKECFKKASSLPIDYCFPYGMESANAIVADLKYNSKDDKAWYYLGNIYADFIPEKAVIQWQKAIDINANVALYHRNIAYLQANVFNQIEQAIIHMDKAIELNPTDPLFLVERDDYLAYQTNNPAKRLELFEKNKSVVEKSDAASIRMMILQNGTGNYQQALKTMESRHFHAFEKFDGNIHVQWVDAHVLNGNKLIELKQYDQAIKAFEASMEFPRNLEIARDSKKDWANYWLGLVYKLKSDKSKAEQYFKKMTEKHQIGGWAGDEWPEVMYAKALSFKELGRIDKESEIIDIMVNKGNDLLKKKSFDASTMLSVGKRHAETLANSKGYFYLALAQLANNNKTKATEFFKKAKELNPEMPTLVLFQ